MLLRKHPNLQLVLLLALLFISASAFAGEPLPWDNGLKKFGDALTGPTVMYIAIIAFAAAGLGLIWGGEMSDMLKKIVMSICAVSFVVGAAGFAKNFLGINVTGGMLPVEHAQAVVIQLRGLLGAC
jgi:type IV secretion system protein VirB2